MSRVIKFRAWDKIENKMWYPDAIRFDLGEILLMKNNGIGGWVTFHEHEGLNDPVMQFTGLLDAKGVEIYEDDRIKTPAGIGEVKWIDGCYRLSWNQRDNTTLHDIQVEHMEVIGNIHQHPSLISREKG